jgi:hypothetical protein
LTQYFSQLLSTHLWRTLKHDLYGLKFYYDKVLHQDWPAPHLVKAPHSLSVFAQPLTAAEHRSVPKQIEYWARLGKAVEDNPELPLQFIKDTQLSIAEANVGHVAEYKFGS